MSLSEQLDRLAAFEPAPYPVVSLYLNTQPGQHGRDQHQAFIRKEFKARSRTYPAGSPERESLDRDLEKISQYLETELQPSSNGVAIFACSAGELFEAIQTGAPFEQHWLHIGDQPHLYPLARLESQYPRYAAVLADTHTARVMVFASGDLVAERDVVGVKTRSTSVRMRRKSSTHSTATGSGGLDPWLFQTSAPPDPFGPPGPFLVTAVNRDCRNQGSDHGQPDHHADNDREGGDFIHEMMPRP